MRAASAFNYILSDSKRRDEIEQILKDHEERFQSEIADALCYYSDKTALYKYLLDGETVPEKLKENLEIDC